jgi:hypothetical protein
MTTEITVQDWQGGHANVGRRSTAPAAPMTPLAAGHGPMRMSADGRYRYARQDGGVFATDLETGVDVAAEAGVGLVGFGSLADARRATADRDAETAQHRQAAERLRRKYRLARMADADEDRDYDPRDTEPNDHLDY